MTRYWSVCVLACLLVVTTVEVAAGQRFGGRGGGRGSMYWNGGDDYTIYNVPYDGRFTFVRLSFTPGSGGGGWGWRGRGQLWWDHDWPTWREMLPRYLDDLA